MIQNRFSLFLILCGAFLCLNGPASLLALGHETNQPTRVGGSSRKLLNILPDTDAGQDESIEFEKYQSDLDEIFGRFEYRREKSPPPPPPPPPHPARYEMCQGIPHKRYKFVRTFGEVKKALEKAKPGDLIEVKSGLYFQGAGAGKSSLIPPDLHVDARGNAEANRRDPREKRILGQEVRAQDSDDNEDDSFATLYEIYSEQYLLPLVEENSFSTPIPAPAPKTPAKDTEDGIQEDTKEEDAKEEDAKEEDGKEDDAKEDDAKEDIKDDKKKSPAPKPSTSPGNSKGAPAPAPAPDSRDDIKIIEAEYEYERYEFDDIEEYTMIDEGKEEDAKAPAPAKEKPSGSRPGPWLAPTGFIDNVHGTEENPITLCGPKTAVFDGSNGDRGLAAAALRVVKSSHIVIKGFTMQNALKGLDIQSTNSSIFSNITTRYTLQEGIRLRYNSTFNLVHGCNISYTGRLWVGIGEGMYVGTSTRNSVGAGLPRDLSDYNNLTSNYFGEGVTAENIDIKEFTTGGVIANNTFNGTSIAGLNGAIAWVAVKGNNYTVADNIGYGTLKGGQGFRVLQKHRGLAHDNVIVNNTCLDFELGSYCVFIDSLARNTRVNCNNKRSATRSLNLAQGMALAPSKRVCNCDIDTTCPRSGLGQTMHIKILRTSGASQEQSTTTTTTASATSTGEFYAQGFPVLPRDRIRDLTDSRLSWE